MPTVRTTKHEITVRRNSGANIGSRERLNFIEGSNVSLTIADDAAANEIDITIASADGVSPVNPAVVDNIVTFADVTGGQKDSGHPISEFIHGDGIHKITVDNVSPANPEVGDMWVDTS